jgi:hypothetical protein
MSNKREPLLMFLYRTVGYRDGTKAAAFAIAWGIYADDPKTEGLPTPEGYRRYWNTSEAAYFRELRAFRAAFVDDQFPDRVWSVLRRGVKSRKLGSATREAMFVESAWA